MPAKSSRPSTRPAASPFRRIPTTIARNPTKHGSTPSANTPPSTASSVPIRASPSKWSDSIAAIASATASSPPPAPTPMPSPRAAPPPTRKWPPISAKTSGSTKSSNASTRRIATDGRCSPSPGKAMLRADERRGAGLYWRMLPSATHANDGGLRFAPPPAPPQRRRAGRRAGDIVLEQWRISQYLSIAAQFFTCIHPRLPRGLFGMCLAI